MIFHKKHWDFLRDLIYNQEHLGIAESSEQLVHKLMTKSRIYDCDTQLIAETTLQQFRVSEDQ